ncbi:hypothetical protein M407DRAFT_32951 [Tulasnella calospora MUT 4182]|uniref:Uncharacterized protein n=1 Tax=Tulasnella calospora MUT 4182 TaxID=1051891 RepID=A0A0C3L7D7_9AGAM|nr:hypothetical protein M407DRAFT_32951 [Tulasnella calospora MUT 4182]
MSSPPPVERFQGTSWEECQEFILAIRAHASWERKQRDPAWMADFAANYFWHHALTWHSRLPKDIRQDWSKLEIALLDRWPVPEDDLPQIRPTPAAAPPLAAAPPPNTNEIPNHLLQGLLKLVLDGSYINYYVKLGNRSMGCSTSDPSEATHVRCIASSGGILLERINHSPPSWLGVRWMSSAPTIGSGSTDDAYITYVDEATLKPPPVGMADRPWQRILCTVLASGEVIPTWKIDETKRITLFTFVSPDKTALALVADPKAYYKNRNDEIRAKLFIEPTA